MSRHRYIIFAALICFVILTILFLTLKQTHHVAPADMIKIRYGTVPFLGDAPAYIAYKQGYFKEEGLDITLVNNMAGFQNLKALFENRIDIASVAELPIAYSVIDKKKYTDFAREDFKIFADMIYSNKIQQVVARRDRGIEKARDLIGKRIGLMAGTTSDFFYDAFMTEFDIDPASIEVVNLSVKEQVGALVRGEVDAIFSWQPYVWRAQTALKDNTILLSTNLIYTTAWLAVAMTTFINENPDVLVRFLRAINKANHYINNNPQQAMVVYAERNDLDLNTISHLWDDIDYKLSLSESLLTTMEAEMRWIYHTKNIKNNKIPNIMPYLYFDAMDQVAPEGVTIIR